MGSRVAPQGEGKLIGKCSNVDPLGGPRVTPSPILEPSGAKGTGNLAGDSWASQEGGPWWLEAQSKGNFLSLHSPFFLTSGGEGPMSASGGAELVVVDGQLVMQPRASPRQEQSVRKVRVNDSRSL